MSTYRLEALLDDEVEVIEIDAPADRPWEASLDAVGIILDKAMTSELWKRGRIRLVQPNGSIRLEMPAK